MQSEKILFHPRSSFAALIEKSDRYAATDWPVLISGESGVGKERIAGRIHSRSMRGAAPFMAINCGAIAESLFESEMFGHEKGSFSGAVNSSPGIIRQCHNGTLFLDEIGETPLAMQAKLLRFIENQEIKSVGATRSTHVNVRVISATNRDLHRGVRTGTFRWDLLQRLSVLQLQIPPLRERRDDLLVIAHSMAKNLYRDLSPEATPVLLGYDWPGNVRQLKNVLIRASLLCEGAIEKEALDEVVKSERSLTETLNQGEHHGFYDSTLEDAERKIILERLRICGGNKKQTAKELGIAKSTLHEKLRKWKGPFLAHAASSVPSASSWRHENSLGL